MSKNRLWRWFGSFVFLLAAVGGGWGWLAKSQQQPVQASIIGSSSGIRLDDYERVTGTRDFVFPQDHGPHLGYLTEWWYYTGNLQDETGRRFGYQLTFFRRAIQPPGERSPRTSDWAADQVYMAHFTLTDVQGKRFSAFERFERGAVGLAGARGDPQYKVWVRDWQVEQVSENEYRVEAKEGGIAVYLNLVDIKGIILQGDQGYSQKGPEKGNASLYYSQTRLITEGTISLDGELHRVEGTSWLDREISTSALGPGQVGWDWFALQLDDGSEIMAYLLRRSDGTIDAFSRGTLIRPDGSTLRLERRDFEILSIGTWRSPHSGGEYPAKWAVRIPSEKIELEVEPLLKDQELNLSFTYWEGAVQVTGLKNAQPISGFGYVELTGYAQSLEGGL